MRRLSLLLLSVAMALPTPSLFAKPKTPPAVVEAPLLPGDFAGWSRAGAGKQGKAAGAIDEANSKVLQELGLTRWTTAQYKRGDEKLDIKALGFGDASGSYGAFTYYTRPGMAPESIGRQGAFDGNHVLFWNGTTVVDAQFSAISAMSAAELRELAAALPQAKGNTAVPPGLPRYLPAADQEKSAVRYALGPESYTRGGGVLPPALIDFSRGAETVTAQYSSRDGDGVVTLIEYPTPQLAIERQKAVSDFLSAGNQAQHPWPDALVQSNQTALLVRRSGPIVIVTSGGFSSEEAKKLLNSVNYQADVVWNNPHGYYSDESRTARLFLGIFALVGLLTGAAIVLGVFFGGGRALYRKLRGKPLSSLEDNQFIQLNIPGK
jgi:hypothetical protein